MLNLEKIKKRRIELNYSMQYMSNKLGFKNASTYLRYENGEYAFKANMIPKLAEILEEDISYFFM